MGRVSASGNGEGSTWLLAHEMFHEWNGHEIRLAQPERLGYWFSEGFSDFCARGLLLRAELVTEDEYVELWNRRLSEYAKNPQRNAPASRIEEAFWSDANVGSLPYQRGDLVALLVDRAIASRSGGQRSLDDLMRALVACARPSSTARTWSSARVSTCRVTTSSRVPTLATSSGADGLQSWRAIARDRSHGGRITIR